MIFLRSSTMFGSAGTKKRDLSDAFFANHTIPRIQIHLDEDALAALRDKVREYTKATISEGGTTWTRSEFN